MNARSHESSVIAPTIAGNREHMDMSNERVIHETEHTVIVAADAPDPKAGGACHQYKVRDRNGDVLCFVSFQHGPIAEAGVNGVQHVDLLAIIRDRLDSFQRGPFSSPVNEVTCGLVSAAIASEETRTRRRQIAGVEGTNKKAAGVEG